MHDAIYQFRNAMQAEGIPPPDEIVPDGKLRRFASNGKRGDDSGWYVLHEDCVPAGSFGDWRTGISQDWRADIGRELTREERAAQKARIDAAKAARAKAEAEERAQAAAQAERDWRAAMPTGTHPYLSTKNINLNGARILAAKLIVPVRIGGALTSLQTIAPDGEKRFLPGGAVAGGYFAIGKPAGVLCIAEGFATGATIHEATGHSVAVAFNAGNLEPVARALRNKYPDAQIIVCADDDAATPGNPGLTKAKAATLAVNGLLAFPDFGADRPIKATDFNDLAAHRGHEAVRQCIALAKASAWPDPLPLIAAHERMPYPVDVLPGLIGEAVREAQAFVQCPVALAACSALTVLSVASQALADVQRGEGLTGPVSLYFLALAESGERKTSCDKVFSTVLSDWDVKQREAMKAEIAKHSADSRAWLAEQKGLEAAIQSAKKNGENTDHLRTDLAAHELAKPKPLLVPGVTHTDITPEQLAHTLANGWHSGAILSSEAGVVFGSHGMGADAVMRNLALLNTLWEGGTLKVERRTSEGFTVSGARLSLGLAAQPDTVRAFFESSKGLARGTGFAARFLLAYPESTQGTRLYRDGGDMPKVRAYLERVRELLDERPAMNEAGELSPSMLKFSPAAKQAWVKYHDDVERELRASGDLADVKDAASKSADNAARIAALFHVFERGTIGDISAEHMQAGAAVAAWHLYEARHVLGQVALPRVLNNAVKMDAWLLGYCREKATASVKRRDAQQLGKIRDGRDLDDALRELAEAGRIRELEEGRQKRILINPALLGGNHGTS